MIVKRFAFKSHIRDEGLGIWVNAIHYCTQLLHFEVEVRVQQNPGGAPEVKEIVAVKKTGGCDGNACHAGKEVEIAKLSDRFLERLEIVRVPKNYVFLLPTREYDLTGFLTYGCGSCLQKGEFARGKLVFPGQSFKIGREERARGSDMITACLVTVKNVAGKAEIVETQPAGTRKVPVSKEKGLESVEAIIEKFGFPEQLIRDFVSSHGAVALSAASWACKQLRAARNRGFAPRRVVPFVLESVNRTLEGRDLDFLKEQGLWVPPEHRRVLPIACNLLTALIERGD